MYDTIQLSEIKRNKENEMNGTESQINYAKTFEQKNIDNIVVIRNRVLNNEKLILEALADPKCEVANIEDAIILINNYIDKIENKSKKDASFAIRIGKDGLNSALFNPGDICDFALFNDLPEILKG